MKRITLSDLETCDGAYNVGHLVTLEHPWVSKREAEEILDIANSHLDWMMQEITENREQNNKTN